MFLSDVAILDEIRSGGIEIEPAVLPENIRAYGLRVHLGSDLLVPVGGRMNEVDLRRPPDGEFEKVLIGDNGYRLESGRFVLGNTVESVRTVPELSCVLDGRSSVARMGLFVHCSSHLIDNIHESARVVVLELFNCSGRPIRLYPQVPIAMLTFARLEGSIAQSASSQYADQRAVLPPRP